MATDAVPARPPESLHAALARWAAHASPRLLLDMFAFGMALGVIATAVNWRLPFGVGCIAVGGLGAWGLLTQFPSSRHPIRQRVLLGAVALIAMLAGLATVVEAMFWAMGPAPQL